MTARSWTVITVGDITSYHATITSVRTVHTREEMQAWTEDLEARRGVVWTFLPDGEPVPVKGERVRLARVGLACLAGP